MSICHVGSFPSLSPSPGENWMLIILLYLMSLLVEQKLRSRRMQTWVEIWEQQASLSLRWCAPAWQHPAHSSWVSGALPVPCAGSRSKDITSTTPGTVSQWLCAQSCSALAKRPVVFFLHRNSHLPRTLCIHFILLYFYILFLMTEKRPTIVHKLYQKLFFFFFLFWC